MKIVFLDAKTIGEDLDLSGYEQLGEVVKYGFSTKEQAAERTKDADVIILNKVPVNEETIGGAEHLKLVCVTATGTDNLDKDYLEKRGIAWRNVAGYSTETVAQHTFALLFYLMDTEVMKHKKRCLKVIRIVMGMKKQIKMLLDQDIQSIKQEYLFK